MWLSSGSSITFDRGPCASCLAEQGLTIHSSRSRFAARLNSGVRAHIVDITGSSSERLEFGVDSFIARHPITYRGVVFQMSSGALRVDSYSEWEPSRTTEAHAREQIARSKLVLANLAEKSSAFQNAIAPLRPQYMFCQDYGHGADVLAREIDGRFEWLVSRNGP